MCAPHPNPKNLSVGAFLPLLLPGLIQFSMKPMGRQALSSSKVSCLPLEQDLLGYYDVIC